MLKGFRDFLMRGNVIDLAVAVILGTAFGVVVKAFADDFVGGLIGTIGGTPNFDSWGVEINKSPVIIGTTITALIYFVIVSAVIYFLLITPMTRLMQMRKAGEISEVQATPEDIALLQEIRDLLKAQSESGGTAPGDRI